MGRKRSPARDNAKNLWIADPSCPLKDIAAKIGVSEEQIRKWKSVDRWDKNKVTLPKKKSNVTNDKNVKKKQLESVENNEELNDREKAFCYHYAQTFNATASVVRAGYAEKYPNRYGYQLMQKPKIREEIQRLKEIRNIEWMASGGDVVEMYMRIAFADITDFVSFSRETVDVMGMFGPVVVKDEETGENETLTKEVNLVKFKDSDYVDGMIISEVKQGKDGASVKLADRMKALAWLAEYFELNPKDRHRVEYDNRRLELEEKKVSMISGDDEDDRPIEIRVVRPGEAVDNDDDSEDD